MNDGDSAGAEFAFGIALADDQFCADGIRRGENIDNFQAARFGNVASGVETNSKEGAIAIAVRFLVA